MALTLVLLDQLAVMLARDGIRTRGVFAKRYPVVAQKALRSTLTEATGTILIARFELPIMDNEGRPYPRALLLDILRRLYTLTGGASFWEQVGLWRDDNADCCVDLAIAVEVWTRDLPTIVSFLAGVCAELQQETIVVRTTSPDILFITPTGPGA